VVSVLGPVVIFHPAGFKDMDASQVRQWVESLPAPAAR
jgi:hypothetical protein